MLRLLCLLLFVSSAIAQEAIVNVDQYHEASLEKWESDMAKFAERNKTETHPDDAILFCGSSSIRLWDTIVDDVAPYHPIQRGFGGSTWSDVAVHIDTLLEPHAFQAVVFFVANDIKGGDADKGHIDKTPEEVLKLVQFVRAKVKEHAPNAQAFFIATTPCEKRWDAWPEIREANQLIADWTKTTPATEFISTEDLYLTDEGTPNAELFVSDRLHLNPTGYEIWGKRIIEVLDAKLTSGEN